jgi:quercetin dioxygenase-like cupin family protein
LVARFGIPPGSSAKRNNWPRARFGSIKGRGSVVEESGKEHGVKKGDFVLVLPNEKHPYQNRSSKTPFMMTCAVPKEYE